MKFVLTNDDGIDAPGLEALRQVANRLGIAATYAPHQAMSGCSHQATTDSPIRVVKVSPGKHSVMGTPVDCVRVAFLGHAEEAEWVLCGINDGGNLGVDTFMSGTVGAAREAALMGKKAVAFSQYRQRRLPFDWASASRIVEHLLPLLLRRPLPARSFWNVNLPHLPPEEDPLPDLVFCQVDPHPLPVNYEQIAGAWHYRSDYHARSRKLGADVDVCFGGRVAISLISLDGGC
jgi:5'-nucleotidase